MIAGAEPSSAASVRRAAVGKRAFPATPERMPAVAKRRKTGAISNRNHCRN
jgi:hypothetical protein